ncbi:hypothetical protein Bra1253DRAFT_00559 [Bradyrhizobium sp. WSM1253]|nr:hypothetical protein Bra1253DRAFT_00559 [Bradyrhizobium sp. WSM1253]
MPHDEFCCRLFLSVSQMQLSRGFRAWHVAVASAPDKVPRSCPGQAATRKRCGVERGPRSRAFAAAWAPALRRTAEGALRRVRGTRPKSIFVFQSTESAHLRLLAACAARALRHSLPPKMPRAQGRPGAGWHPRSTVRRLRYKRLHSGIQVKPNTRPSLRSGLTAYVVISPGSDALLPPSPCGWLMRMPGRAAHITTRLDAQTPGVRTTRFCRTRITPVVCATPSFTVARPAKPSRRCGPRPPRPIPRS